MWSGSLVFTYFILYSALGWVCETIFCSIREKKYVNRGFLKGPCCPIYGFGAVAILLVATPFMNHPVLVFVAGMAAATALEYFASWLLEAMFQVRWWDYSDQKFNLNGRICLSFALLFGAMGWVMCYFLHPFVSGLLGAVPPTYRRPLINLAAAGFLLDLLFTLSNLLGFTQRLRKIQTELGELQKYHQKYDWFDPKNIGGSLERLGQICAQEPDNPAAADILARLYSLREKLETGNRLSNAFPSMRAGELGDAVRGVRQSIQSRRGSVRQKSQRFVTRLGDKTLMAGKSFVSRFNYYELFWVFVIASVLGYIIETIYCLVTTGAVESRQGMLYGPFNQVYVFGAVLMVLLLTPLRGKSDRWLFAGSALLGGGYEILCSVIQEHLFASSSWQYSGQPFAVAGGRTSLTFMFFWGILGLWFIKGVYPKLLQIIRRFSRRMSIPLTCVLTVLLCVNMILSGSAVARWGARSRQVLPANGYEEFLDQNYPDEIMRDVYPNMELLRAGKTS